MLAPLDDPTYAPVHRPVEGQVPEVVARWGPRSQLRWFRRFWQQLAAGQRLDRFYCESEHHRDTCCASCFDEYQDGYGVMMDAWCCCRGFRAKS